MTALDVTAKELIGYLTDIVEENGDVPVIIDRADHGAIESIGRPTVVPVNPHGTVGDFQAYKRARHRDDHIKAVLID